MTLSTAQLVIYSILLPPTAFVLFKHGKNGLLGWFYLVAFYMLRIVGGGMALSKSSSAAIVSNVGLSPLILAAAGVLHEARIHRLPHMDHKVEWIKVLLLHLQVTAGVGLLATGASGLQGSKLSATDHTLVKVGIAILTVAWAVVSGWAVWTLYSGNGAHTRAQRLATTLLHSVLFACLFIGIRTLYALAAMTSDSRSLDPNSGSLAVRVTLGLLPELIAALGLVAAGVYSRNLAAAAPADEPGYEQAVGSTSFEMKQGPSSHLGSREQGGHEEQALSRAV